MGADFFDDGGTCCGKRGAGEAAGFAAVAVAGDGGFVEGGIGGDDTVDVGFGNGVEGGVKRGVVQVGRDLDDYWHAAGGIFGEALLFGFDAREQLA